MKAKPERIDDHQWDSVIQLIAGIIAAVVILWIFFHSQIELSSLIELIPAALGIGEMGRRHGRKRQRQR